MSRGNEKRKTRAWKRNIRRQSLIKLIMLLRGLNLKSIDLNNFRVRAYVDKYEHLPVRPGPWWY